MVVGRATPFTAGSARFNQTFGEGESMRVDGLLIPDVLLAAIDAGRWPRTADEALKQNLRPLVPEERIRRLAPEESQLYLYPPPFATVARALAGSGRDFYTRFGAVEQLVPEATIEIADFGLGSDALVVLDYRAGPTDPRVLRLLWPGDGQSNRWVVMAPDFPTFVEALRL
jgi:hypothetical protein